MPFFRKAFYATQAYALSFRCGHERCHEVRRQDRIDQREARHQNFKRPTALAMREETPFGRGVERL
ncbi:hypothetical protein ATY79_11860 [Rhizobium sp. R693]|nr:hypothetical protein ATY79_11860 [Rhizobium sp. R693]